MDKYVFEALSAETLPLRLSGNAALCDRIGGEHGRWQVKEVGDGNLNLVFIVTGEKGAAIVKQALPYVRLVGERWPLPLKRSYFEYHALTRQAARDPGMVPEILFFDAEQAMIIMEYLTPHVILRRALIAGRKLPKIGRDLGLFAARTLFRGSDLSMPTRDKKADLALFADNVELCDITENLVFSDPYFEAEMNRHTTPHLDSLVEELRRDRDLKVEAQRLKHIFSAKAETLCHGDLHTGSVMVTDDETRVIDPEFAFYGPIGFDVGMLLGELLDELLLARQATRALPANAIRCAPTCWIRQRRSGKPSATSFPRSGAASARVSSIRRAFSKSATTRSAPNRR